MMQYVEYAQKNQLSIYSPVIAESLSEEEIAGLKEMFKMIDTYNSGHITLEELKTGLERVGADLKDSEITWLMQSDFQTKEKSLSGGEFKDTALLSVFGPKMNILA